MWAAAAVSLVAVAVALAVVLATRGGSGGPPGGAVSSDHGHLGRPSPGPIPEHMAVVDDSGTGQVYPGGLVKLDPAHGGKWLLVYERFDNHVATVYAREGADLLGSFGDAVRISDPAVQSFDPGVVQQDDGSIVVTWEANKGFWYSVRHAEGSYSAPTELFTESGGGAFEQTVTRLHGHAYMFYDFHPFSRPEYLWDVRMRQIMNGPSAGPPVTVATNGPGFGAQGAQKRVTAAETGDPDGVIAVWNGHTNPPCNAASAADARTKCGARPIDGAVSADGGRTWGTPFQIAAMPGHDLVNPFVLSLGGHRLRVYFSVDRHLPESGFVESNDGGRTWGSIQDVWFPRGISPARMIVQDTPRDGLVAVVPTRGFFVLGTFPLADATRPNALKS